MPRSQVKGKLSIHDICGYRVELTRKPIKNIYLRIDPTHNGLRISAPTKVKLSEIKDLILEKNSWIAQKQQQAQKRQLPEPTFDHGEIHYFKGQCLSLDCVSDPLKAMVTTDLQGSVLHLPATTDQSSRAHAIEKLYTNYLQQIIPPLLELWQQRIGVQINEWRLRTMKTRWGSCNIVKKRIWLNRTLAKYRKEEIEYVLVHELIHLLERGHNARFYSFMDHFLPDWRKRRTRLNRPLHQSTNSSRKTEI
jgi:predicted metal-dependent hydrolase